MTLTLSPPDPSVAADAVADVDIEIDIDADPGMIPLAGHCTTVTAEQLRKALVRAADCGTETAIDASDALSVGQAVLQLLIAARSDAIQVGHPYHFTGASAAFAERVVGCQLAEAIGLDAGKDVSL